MVSKSLLGLYVKCLPAQLRRRVEEYTDEETLLETSSMFLTFLEKKVDKYYEVLDDLESLHRVFSEEGRRGTLRSILKAAEGVKPMREDDPEARRLLFVLAGECKRCSKNIEDISYLINERIRDFFRTFRHLAALEEPRERVFFALKSRPRARNFSKYQGIDLGNILDYSLKLVVVLSMKTSDHMRTVCEVTGSKIGFLWSLDVLKTKHLSDVLDSISDEIARRLAIGRGRPPLDEYIEEVIERVRAIGEDSVIDQLAKVRSEVESYCKYVASVTG